MYERRKREEILWAGNLYPPFEYDREDLGWLHLLRLPLPPGRWNKSTTELLILLDEAYPEIPPHRIYIDQGLRDRRGKAPAHYFEDGPNEKEGWAWFCLHLEEGWTPRRRTEDGDNLVTVIERVQVGLAGRKGHGR